MHDWQRNTKTPPAELAWVTFRTRQIAQTPATGMACMIARNSAAPVSDWPPGRFIIEAFAYIAVFPSSKS